MSDGTRGYVDLLGDAPSGADTASQRLMTSRLYPLVYERWRSVAGRVLTGATLAGAGVEDPTTRDLLALQPGDRVLDVACGPGNISRRLARDVGESGSVIGLDASPTMLAQAVRDTRAPNVSFVRGDAQSLPFDDASFDAVCCYAALYLIADPLRAISEMARVLAPGGRVAVLTSVQRGPAALTPLVNLVTAPSGFRVFGRDEVTSAFRAAGLTDVRRRVSGLAQFVGARKA